MKKFLWFPLLAAMSIPAAAQEATALDNWRANPAQVFDAADVVLDDLRWQARAIVVFANSEFDPLFIRQVDLLTSEIDELVERDVIVITDTAPDTPSSLRNKLRPRAFMLALIGKDGQTKLRKPAPWNVRELSRSIDKTPLRQQEISDRRVVVPRSELIE